MTMQQMLRLQLQRVKRQVLLPAAGGKVGRARHSTMQPAVTEATGQAGRQQLCILLLVGSHPY
jgi:hypothetical protein